MVGMTMVMLMILIGRPEFASYVPTSPSKDRRAEGGSVSYSDEASRISSATSRRKRDAVNKASLANMGMCSSLLLIHLSAIWDNPLNEALMQVLLYCDKSLIYSSAVRKYV